MIDAGKRDVLGVGINVIDYDAAVQRIMNAAQARQSFSASALAVHGVMTGVMDHEQRYRLNHLELVTPDGQPVRWALWFLHGVRLPDRVYGPTLMLKVCEQAAKIGIPIFLFGSTGPVLAALAQNLKSTFPRLLIGGMEPSSFRRGTARESGALDARIRASGARLVFVGIGCPRQEVFAYEHSAALSCPVISVGAAFEFHAGKLKQAPKWMQDRGLEWLFRLWTDPKRLWRRYIYLNPSYCVLIAAQKLGVFRSHAAIDSPKEKQNFL